MEKLNVLVLESERNAAHLACEELEAAGHTVLRCHEPGAPAFPCRALVGGKQCPLEEHIVDVALDLRLRPRSQPSPLEDGVNCALRHHIPVVVAGSAVLNPYTDYATETVEDRDGDVAGACERAAGAPLRPHTKAAALALREVLDRRNLAAAPIVTVLRRRGSLVINVSQPHWLDEATKSMAAVRMTAAVRAIDRAARGVDVVFEGADRRYGV